jgi:trimeric autotransporter adhesin
MSTKTLRKRIALVAVSALGAGLLSVVAVPSANAAAGDTTADSLWLATTNSSTGAPLTTAAGGDVVAATDKSVGFLAVTSANAAGAQVVQVGGTGVLAGTTGTAVALSTAQLRFNVGTPTAVASLVVSGGTLSGGTVKTGGPTIAYNGSNTAIVGSAAGAYFSAVATPIAGATTMTVSTYQGTGVTTTLPTNGTLIGRWVVTITAAAASGTFSPALSPVGITTTANAAAITSSIDASTSGILAGNPLFIQVLGNNPYGQALTSGTYIAQATNGATVAWGDRGAAIAAGTLSFATATPDGTDQLRIDPASSLTTSTTTVTITHDGAPVATKTLTFYGEAKKIVIESVKSGRTGTDLAGNTATAYAVYSYRDSADGKVPGAAATFSGLSATSIVTTGKSVRSPSRSVQAAIADGQFADAVETSIGAGADGVFAFSCGTTSGTSTVTISHTNAISLATITAPVTVSCNGGIATYTVSADKASYAVGEIATITIDAKDSSGNAVSDNTVIAANSVSVGGGSLTVAIAGTEMFSAGKRTVQAQMTTAGTFNTVVTLAGSTTTNATVKYAVTDGATSNSDVLKAIVSLIASINKQIAALQKALLRR